MAQQFSLSGEAELLRKNQVFPTALTSLWIVQARFALRYWVLCRIFPWLQVVGGIFYSSSFWSAWSAPAVSECGVAEQFYAGIEPSVERLGRVELQSAAFLAADGAVTDARTNVLTDSRTDRRAVSRLLQTKSWYSQSQSLLETDNINSILNNINNIECPSSSAASSLTMASW